MFFAVVNGNYIASIGEAEREIETAISEERCLEIKRRVGMHPDAPDGFQYRLRADNLEWELVELPPAPAEDDAATLEDYEAALREVGVEV